MRNQLKTILLFGVLSALLIGIGGALRPNQLGLFIAIAAVMNIVSYFWSDKIVLRIYRARPLSETDAPGLHAMVSELAARAQIPKPRLFIVPGAQPNAFATGRNPKHGAVAVTEGLMQMLDHREVRGVLAHEMAHIKNRDVLISTAAAVIASAITTVANVLTFGAMFGGRRSSSEGGGNPLVLLFTIIVAPIAAVLIQLAISRSRELAADQTGAQLDGDPDGLINALVKLERAAKVVPPAHAEPATANLFIVNPFGAREAMAKWFSTHPPMAERISRLEELRDDSGELRARRFPRHAAHHV
ncbi:MAG TPA: zinc metalloprotease HtpX [Kofleriaceae bacterium]|nr:zinc metalloprotease HtpX [Kofleriaceae bacterium]